MLNLHAEIAVGAQAHLCPLHALYESRLLGQ